MPGRLAATDARMFWLSQRMPTDQFVLFAFDGAVSDPAALVRVLRATAQRIDDLAVRLRETPFTVDHPYWVRARVTEERFRVAPSCDLQGCLDDVSSRFEQPVDPRLSPWRVHLYPEVHGTAGSVCSVLVLQVSHAMGDGGWVSMLARRLVAGETDVAPLLSSLSIRRTLPAPLAVVRGVVEIPWRVGRLMVLARRAIAADRDRAAATAAGTLPGPPMGCALPEPSRPPTAPTKVRCLVVDRADLTNDVASVTVTALVAVSEAMGPDRPADLSAEVMIAIPPDLRTTNARNAFHNAGVPLHPGLTDLRARAVAIAGSLSERRRRLAHPAFGAGDRVTECVPAVFLARDVAGADLDARPDTVAGHTVVSSVDRGDGALALGGRPVTFTAGFPALSRWVGITHGVHGIGDTVTLSVVTSDAATPDVDAYVERLRTAVSRVRDALR